MAGLELREDPRFMRRSWRAERAGWAAMALLIAAALAGLLGPGPLSKARAEAADGTLIAEYHSLERHHAESHLRLSFPKADGAVRLSMSREFAKRAGFQAIDPEPETIETDAQNVVYVFRAKAGGGASFVLKNDSFGRVKGRLQADGGAPVELSQFVFP